MRHLSLGPTLETLLDQYANAIEYADRVSTGKLIMMRYEQAVIMRKYVAIAAGDSKMIGIIDSILHDELERVEAISKRPRKAINVAGDFSKIGDYFGKKKK